MYFMNMRQFSTVDLVRDIKEFTHAATRAPVAITHHRKPRYVLIAIEDYEKLRRSADPRRAYRSGETPSELSDMILEHLDRQISELPDDT
jgi:PHD/YefM family antitoxin component YafN of YafNO toxin-antitoxin module